MRSNFLFIGGQHHGSVLPVWSDSVAAAAVSVEAELRAGPGKRIYAGYFPWHMSLRGGGLRQLAVHSSVRHGGRFWEEVADAFSIALDNCQRVLESVRDRHRPVPRSTRPWTMSPACRASGGIAVPTPTPWGNTEQA